MRDKKELPLRELVDKMLRAYGLGNRLDEMKLIKSWEEVVGSMISKHTNSVNLKSGTLYVSLDSAPLKQELSYAKTKLIEKLNQSAGKPLVKEIVLT